MVARSYLKLKEINKMSINISFPADLLAKLQTAQFTFYDGTVISPIDSRPAPITEGGGETVPPVQPIPPPNVKDDDVSPGYPTPSAPRGDGYTPIPQNDYESYEYGQPPKRGIYSAQLDRIEAALELIQVKLANIECKLVVALHST